jgi:hypothetical protein
MRRTLSRLEVAGLVDVEISNDGTGVAALNVAGLELCRALFSA